MKFSITLAAMTLAELYASAAEFARQGDTDDETDDEDGGTPATIAPDATDAQGVPWSEEWHAKNKGTNADGTWRLKKRIDRSGYAAWCAQVKGAAPVMQQQPAQMMQPAQTTTLQPMQSPMPMLTQQQPAMMMQPSPVPGAQPMQQMQPAQQQPAGVDFNGFLMKIGPLMQSGQLPPNTLNEILTSVGIANLDTLSANQQMLPAVINALAMRGLWS